MERAWKAIQQAGFHTVNLDLMVGLVGETDGSFLSSLERVIQLGPDCITIYQLEIPLNTPLYRSLQAGTVEPDQLMDKAYGMAQELATGPWFAHTVTKKCLHQEWSQSIEQALETEAEAQAICMQTKDFERAYHAFVNKQKPAFEGN